MTEDAKKQARRAALAKIRDAMQEHMRHGEPNPDRLLSLCVVAIDAIGDVLELEDSPNVCPDCGKPTLRVCGPDLFRCTPCARTFHANWLAR